MIISASLLLNCNIALTNLFNSDEEVEEPEQEPEEDGSEGIIN